MITNRTKNKMREKKTIYLICHCIQNRKYAWKTTANSNSDETCNSNTNHYNHNVKSKKCDTEPAKHNMHDGYINATQKHGTKA
jgi:hypothetical protein